MLWSDATKVVDVSAASAWKSLDALLMQIIKIPTAGEETVKVIRIEENVPVIHVGNRIVAKAAMLGGIIKASMSMEVVDSEPPRYLRLAIHTYNMHFADIEFRIESVESGCRMTFRQGFRTKKKPARQTGEQVDTKAREMPETARVFNLWVRLTKSV
jgi:hypothetical protein